MAWIEWTVDQLAAWFILGVAVGVIVRAGLRIFFRLSR